MDKKQVGFIGLGNMGKNMVFRLLEQGWEVHAWNRSAPPRVEVEKEGAKVYESIPDLIENLKGRKVLFSMIAAGEPVDEVIEQTVSDESENRRLNSGDIFIDGVNSHYKDSIRRGDKLLEKGIHLIDCGVSGGIVGARNGACIMAGGDKGAFEYIEDLISDMSTESGYGYFGKRGSGHYVKMVHNAIEYATMQAMGEGFNLLHKSGFDVDLSKLTDVWNHGSIIAGNLMGIMHTAFSKDNKLDNAPTMVGSLGTGKWAVEEALEREVPFTNIANAVYTRYASRERDEIIHKVISALRAEFGGHTEHERPQR
ncbi:MAG: phosphogluconate dehydrogenase (NAD(+)-dependent, decarboxylating) [Candidatus Dojkabacteria bacterium]